MNKIVEAQEVETVQKNKEQAVEHGREGAQYVVEHAEEGHEYVVEAWEYVLEQPDEHVVEHGAESEECFATEENQEQGLEFICGDVSEDFSPPKRAKVN